MSALRIAFEAANVAVDELEVFGPADQRKNFALASAGTKLITDESMTQLRGDLSHANDGEFGTQAKLTYAWVESGTSGVRPRVRIRRWMGHWKPEMDLLG